MNKACSPRLTSLDAARGMAMLLVCTAHFLDVYRATTQQENLLVTCLLVLSKIASPSFVLVSGILLGYLSKVKHEDFVQLRLHLLDRALFLVTAGHILMAASLAIKSGFVAALSRGFVTDTLGFCTIAGLLVLPYARVSSIRLLLGILLYLIGWAGWNSWHPESPLLIALRGIFLGPDENGTGIFCFPLLPWFGVYLVGTFIGDWLGTFERSNFPLAATTLAKLSAIIFGGVVLTKAVLFLLQIPHSMYLPWFSYSKSPPGPFYIMTFGSAALFLLAVLLWASRTEDARHYLKIAERLGRNSLSVFVTQSFFYYTAFYLIMAHFYLSTFPVAILLLIGSLFCIVWLSSVFERFRLNRVWTVGLPSLAYQWSGLNLVSGKFPFRNASSGESSTAT
jgi:uncharacterized membrane protein